MKLSTNRPNSHGIRNRYDCMLTPTALRQDDRRITNCGPLHANSNFVRRGLGAGESRLLLLHRVWRWSCSRVDPNGGKRGTRPFFTRIKKEATRRWPFALQVDASRLEDVRETDLHRTRIVTQGAGPGRPSQQPAAQDARGPAIIGHLRPSAVDGGALGHRMHIAQRQ